MSWLLYVLCAIFAAKLSYDLLFIKVWAACNFKNARNGKKHVKNIKMAKFEAPGIKEWDFMTIWIFLKKDKKYVRKRFLQRYPLNFLKIQIDV